MRASFQVLQRILFVGMVFLCSSSAVRGAPASKSNIPATPDDLVFEKDIQYREGHERWKLNVIRPKKKSWRRRSVIVLVHGGGWSSGDHYRFTFMGFQFARKGYVVVLPTYRLYQDAPFPACLEDVKNAIRWIRANADKYHIHPDRIGAYGNSAGGTLALTAALTQHDQLFEGSGSHLDQSSALQAVVCSGAVGDMRHPSHGRRAKTAYLNLARGKNRNLPDVRAQVVMRQASPSSYISASSPPLLLVHGAADDVVAIESTDEFVKEMKTAGADVTHLRFEDGHHGVMGQKGRTTTPAMHAFFKKHLSNPPQEQRGDRTE